MWDSEASHSLLARFVVDGDGAVCDLAGPKEHGLEFHLQNIWREEVTDGDGVDGVCSKRRWWSPSPWNFHFFSQFQTKELKKVGQTYACSFFKSPNHNLQRI